MKAIDDMNLIELQQHAHSLTGEIHEKITQGRLMLMFGIMIGCALTQLFM